ncbi:TonB family protein [Chryseolinea sp. T2]|uniref:energy transducer TonB n=1 Tax=Chryseolinea sp. T2 TaxID=3129255 RepID=UPI0030770AF9
MKTGSNESRSWEDIIFENRNHEYGAYAVRKAYPSNVNRATTVTLGLAAAIAAYSFVATNKRYIPSMPVDPPVIDLGSVVEIIPIKKIEPPATKIQQTRGELPPVATAEPVKEAVIPDEPQTFQPGSETGTDAQTVTGVPGGEIQTVVEAPPVEIVDPIFLNPEVGASYKGGLEAMARFVSRNLRYPAIARRMGIEGTVYIGFIVGKSGEILEATVIKGIHASCDAEALRVVNLMKDWSPGMQAGAPVKVRMVLPIKFTLQQ